MMVPFQEHCGITVLHKKHETNTLTKTLRHTPKTELQQKKNNFTLNFYVLCKILAYHMSICDADITNYKS